MVVDWSQFWPSMIATFVGFALALFGEWIIRVISKNAAAKELKKQLAEEINSICKDLDELNDDVVMENPLKTPLWKAAISSNSIASLDKDSYSDFSRLYDAIEEYNSWFSKKTDLILNNKLNDLSVDIDNRLEQLKEYIKSNKI